MAFTVYVQMKRLGKQKRGGIEKTAFILEQKPETAGELIEGLVRLSVRAYNARKDEGQLLPWLTGEEIAAMASAGKVSFGVRGGGDQDEEKAVANALRCFEDGIYRMFADEEELTGLSQPIPWQEETVFTFIRLTMLSGW